MQFRLVLLAFLTLSMAASASAVWQYDNYPTYTTGSAWWHDNTHTPRGSWQPAFPRFTAYENRPEGFGLVAPKPAYPVPGIHPQARFCENTQTLGHYSRWTDWWHSGHTGAPRIAPRARLDSGYCSPQWRYDPTEYWWA